MVKNNAIYSVIVAVYNDGYLAADFCDALQKAMSHYLNCSNLSKVMELIFINDGSQDNSLEQLIQLREIFNFVKIINLSRNFGQHQALAAGFYSSEGDFIIRSNIDMQEPLSEIPKFLETMNEYDCDVVIGKYDQRNSPFFTRITSRFFFKVFNFFTGFKIPFDTSPMRVMSRRYINCYNKLTEKNPFPQGITEILGFNIKYIKVAHNKRIDGKSAYTFFSRLRQATNGMLYFTERPIHLIIYFGFFCSMVAFIIGAIIFTRRFFGINMLPGYASLVIFMTFGFGIQVSVIGLIGLYIGKIFTEVKNRPLYIIEKIYEIKGKSHE